MASDSATARLAQCIFESADSIWSKQDTRRLCVKLLVPFLEAKLSLIHLLITTEFSLAPNMRVTIAKRLRQIEFRYQVTGD